MKEEGRRYLSREAYEQLVAKVGVERAELLVDVTFEKMSKSKGNGVLPAQVTELHGVDALRSAILFSAPPEHDVNFDFAVIKSMETYLHRFFRLSEQLFESTSTFNRSDLLSKFKDIEHSESTRVFAEQSLTLLIDYEH
jgi:leucyl-tRNA synthetase